MKEEKMVNGYEENADYKKRKRITASAVISVILAAVLFVVCGGGTYAVTTIQAVLLDGATQLDEGSFLVNDGAGQLKDGSLELVDGGVTLKEGIAEYTDGVAMVHEGIGILQEGVIEYTDGVAQLKDGNEQIRAGVSVAKDGSNQLLDGARQIHDGLAELNSNSAGLNEAPELLIDALDQLWYGLDMMPKASDVAMLTDGSTAMKGALETAATSATELSTSIKGVQTQIKEANDESKKYLDSANIVASLNTESLVALLSEDPSFAENIIKVAQSYVETNNKVKAASSANTKVSINAGLGATGLGLVSKLYGDLNEGVQLLSDLPGGVILLQEGIDAIKADVLHPTEGLKVGLAAYTDGVYQLLIGSKDLRAGMGDLKSGLGELYDGAKLAATGANELNINSPVLMGGVQELSKGVSMLHANSILLIDGAEQINGGIGMLSDGLHELNDGTNQLLEGTNLLVRSLRFSK